MKKLILRVVLALVVLLIIAIVGVFMFLDRGVKKGVETVGPLVTKVPVKLDGVSLSPFSGSGKLKGLVIGNPEGFKSPSAISVGNASLKVEPGSVFKDKIIIRSIIVEAPEITYETDFKTSNLGKLQANIEAAMPADSETPSGTPASKQDETSRKLQVDEFRITGGKINVSATALGGKSIPVALPELSLKGLGTGPDGITAAELTKRVLDLIINESLKAGSGAVGDLGKQATELGKQLGDSATGSVKDATKGITDLFKKKEK